MTNVDQNTAAEKTERVAKHEWLDKTGNPVDAIEDAWGYRFTHGGLDEPFDVLFEDLPEVGQRALALFGAKTKTTNEASGVRNGKMKGTPDAGPEAQMAAVKEFFSRLAKDGEWSAPSEGGVAVRIDKDALAHAICLVLVAEGKKSQGDIDSGHKAKVREKLESDPQYVRKTRQVPQVATEYAKIVGRPTATVDDLEV
jgi:hypothetical protein